MKKAVNYIVLVNLLFIVLNVAELIYAGYFRDEYNVTGEYTVLNSVLWILLALALISFTESCICILKRRGEEKKIFFTVVGVGLTTVLLFVNIFYVNYAYGQIRRYRPETVVSDDSAGNSADSGSAKADGEKKNVILDISSYFEFAYRCRTVEELKEHASAVLMGTVMEEQPWVDNDATIGTDYTVQVDKCYLGGLDADSTITISNLGGYVPAKEYFDKQDDPKAEPYRKEMEENPDNAYVRFLCDGAWLPEVGKKYIWFVEVLQEQGKTIYTPVNVYEGIYEIKNNSVERFAPASMEIMPDGTASIPENIMTFSRMEQEIDK